MKNNSLPAEIFPLVNEHGQTIGSAPRSECHGDPAKLHPVVHCIIINGKDELLLQLRSENKDIQPGKWDTSVGGHIQLGEKTEDALIREVNEEVGITLQTGMGKFLYSYIMSNDIESELVHTYLLRHNGPFKMQEEEISQLKFWSQEKICDNIGKSVFTPNFEDEFSRFSNLIANTEKT